VQTRHACEQRAAPSLATIERLNKELAMAALALVVSRADLNDTDIIEVASIPLEEGQIRTRVVSFAFTANNVTYAGARRALPLLGLLSSPAGARHRPVWGFADVVETRHRRFPSARRIYGLLPMANGSDAAAGARRRTCALSTQRAASAGPCGRPTTCACA
jgi:hypothetical protein